MGFWHYVLFVVVLFLSWMLGIFGFYNIIGGIRIYKWRGAIQTIMTVLFWGSILTLAFVLAYKFLPQFQTAVYIGMGLSLIMSLGAGKDGPEN